MQAVSSWHNPPCEQYPQVLWRLAQIELVEAAVLTLVVVLEPPEDMPLLPELAMEAEAEVVVAAEEAALLLLGHAGAAEQE